MSDRHYVVRSPRRARSQPDTASGVDPATGNSPLPRETRAAALYPEAGYSPAAPKAFGTGSHSAAFTDWLHFTGPPDIEAIRCEPNVLTTSAGRWRSAAKDEARRFASVAPSARRPA